MLNISCGCVAQAFLNCFSNFYHVWQFSILWSGFVLAFVYCFSKCILEIGGGLISTENLLWRWRKDVKEVLLKFRPICFVLNGLCTNSIFVQTDFREKYIYIKSKTIFAPNRLLPKIDLNATSTYASKRLVNQNHFCTKPIVKRNWR